MTGREICAQLDKLREQGVEHDEICETAVRLLHEAHRCYHWTGIYELFPDAQLRLGPYVGAPTDHTFIGVGNGVCGSAVADKCNKNIPDVTKESNYLACSSATKSELVVLIRKGDEIFAQIDIDSHEPDAFTSEMERDVEQIADWLAEQYEHSRGRQPQDRSNRRS